MLTKASPPLDSTLARDISLTKLLLQLGPAVLLISILFGGGLLLGLLQALGLQPGSATDGITLHHFKALITAPDFLESLGLTFYISVTSTCIAAAVSIFLALSLHSFSDKSKLIHFLLQIPLTIPHLAVAAAFILLLSPTGMIARLIHPVISHLGFGSFPLLVNDPAAIGILTVYIWKEVPFVTLMLLAVLKNMGPELDEVGATLKADKLQRFRFITLPTLLPALSGGSLIVFAFTFGAFEVPYLLGQTYPVPLSVWAYRNYSDIDLLMRPEGIALGLLLAGFIIVTLITANYLFNRTRERST